MVVMSSYTDQLKNIRMMQLSVSQYFSPDKLLQTYGLKRDLTEII